MTSSSSSDWWDVVKAMAAFVGSGFDESDLTESEMRRELLAQGFTESAVAMAVAWVEKAQVSGSLSESLAMLQASDTLLSIRLSNPIERICINDRLWLRLYSCRQKGLLSQELFERLVEGVRTIDVRDWDEFDETQMLEELLVTLLPQHSLAECRRLLSGQYPSFLS